jgi:hypothetical protein
VHREDMPPNASQFDGVSDYRIVVRSGAGT